MYGEVTINKMRPKDCLYGAVGNGVCCQACCYKLDPQIPHVIGEKGFLQVVF